MLRDLPPLGPRISHDEELFMTGALGDDDGDNDDHHASTVDPLDDVFGSAPSSPSIPPGDVSLRTGAERAEHSDIPRLRSIHVTNGYREGIAVSKEEYIQAGFDEGFSLGGEIGTKVGKCLGVLEGIWLAARKAASRAGGSKEDGRAELMQKAKLLYTQAQEDLKMEKLLSPEYFGQDGIWLYDVPGQDASDEELHVTFADVASAHPVIKKWTADVSELAKSSGLNLNDEELEK